MARNQLWLPKLIKCFENHPKNSLVVVVGSYHFPGPTAGLLTLLSKEGFTFTAFDTGASPKVEYVGIQKSSTGPLPKLVPKATKAQIDAVDECLSIKGKWTLPQIIEPGNPTKDASSIRSELVNVMINIGKTGLYMKRIRDYINARDALYSDSEITDKEMAIESLQ